MARNLWTGSRGAGGPTMLAVAAAALGLSTLVAVVTAELVQVQVVMRAGARRWVPYNKPRKEMGAGLLPAGYAEMEQVGKLLKARYFGPTAEVPLANVTTIYKHGDALIRAVARDQTASSADAMAFGIWSPVAAADQTKAKAVPLTGGYQAVPAFTISRGMDYLLSAATACPAIDEYTEKFFNSTAFKQKADATVGVREQLGSALNMSSELQDMTYMYDRVLLATKYNDVPSGGEVLPPITAEQQAALKDMADFVEKGKYGDPSVGFLCGGPLLSEIFDRMAAMTAEVRYRATPFLVYVGSHSTLACALSALSPTDPTLTGGIHNYGSLLVFELHKVGEDYFLNTLFMEGEGTVFENVHFGKTADGPCGDGGMLCPLNEAKRILDGRLEANLLDWCDKCANSFMMPACIQSLQVKMSEAIEGGGGKRSRNGGGSKHRQRMDTVGAAFIGLFAGAFVALASNALAPRLRRQWAERGGRGYAEHMEGGIEASSARGGAV